MAKKRVGLAAFDKDVTDARFKSFGTDMMNAQHEQLNSQLETFQQALYAFASVHAKEIRANPIFRAQFSQMCNTIGIDPLSSTRVQGKSNFLTDMLGLGDIYHELAVQVVDICRRTKPDNGGLMAVEDIAKRINDRSRTFGKNEIGVDDVIRSVRCLKILESGFEVVTVGSTQMVRSVPRELNIDQSTVLDTAQIAGRISVSMLCLNFHWKKERATSVLEDLLSAGMLWVDDQGQETEFWLASSIGVA